MIKCIFYCLQPGTGIVLATLLPPQKILVELLGRNRISTFKRSFTRYGLFILYKSLISFVIKIAISLALIVLLSRVVDFSEALSILPSIQLIYLFIIFFLIFLDRLVMSIKWNILLRAKNIHVPLFEVVKIYYIGNFLGSFLPATVGVDIARGWRLSRYEPDLTKIASSIIIERVLGFVVLSVFSLAAVTVLLAHVDTDLSNMAWVNLSAFLIVSAVFGVSISKRMRIRVDKQLARFRGHDVFHKLKKFYDAYQEYGDAKRSLTLFSILTFLETTLPIIVNYFVAVALNISIPFYYFMVVIPIFLFLSRIPISIDGIGVQQGLFVVLFSFFGVPPSQALSMGILQHILTFLAMTPGLVFYLLDPTPKRGTQYSGG